MVVSIDTTSCSAIRTTFLALLLVQLNNPLYETFWSYQYSLNFLTNVGCKTLLTENFCIWPQDSACAQAKKNIIPTFDYVVVGAGPTGSTIASRLAKSFPTRMVLLIESGNIPPVDTVAPQFFPFDLQITSSNVYTAEKKEITIVDSPTAPVRSVGTSDQFGLGYKNGIPCDCGKALGGGSAMNAMMFVCGPSADYEGWKTSTGDNSWGWGTGATTTPDGIWSYLKRLTTIDDPKLSDTCRSYYGTTGNLYVSDANSSSPMIPLMATAAAEAGYPVLESINCGKQIGFANVHGTIKNKERNHAGRALLSPLRGQLNLLIMRDTTVTKVNLATNLFGAVTASGVSVVTSETNCTSFNIKATREIVLSAGAYNSPKILLQSGVGRAVDLSYPDGNITQRLNLPVGLNFHDHALSLHFFTIQASQQEISDAAFQVLTLGDQALEYINSRSGPFTYIGNMMFSAFLNTNDPTNNPTGVPNVQWIFYLFDIQQIEMASILDKFSIAPAYANQIIAANQNNKIMMVFNILLEPKSRGIIRLSSGSNPTLPPKIYQNPFTDATGYDRRTVIDGIGRLQQYFSTPTMSSLSAQLLKFNITECDSLPYPSDDYWTCYHKYFAQNMWHPAGSCKMGKTTDSTSVVDPTLKVIGITGAPRVRVADASIMPQITRGNTQCPCYLIGQKAADIIKAVG